MRYFRIVLVGDPNVGKTSIINRINNDKFTSTSYFDKIKVDVNLPNRESVELIFQDTQGQERYRTLTRGYFQNSQAVLMIFDLNNRKSFDNLRNLYEIYSTNIDDFKTKRFLVGNKSDLESKIDALDCENLKDRINCEFYCFTSAKTGDGISDLINELVENLLDDDNLIFPMPETERSCWGKYCNIL